MSIIDALLGRTSTPKPNKNRLFAMSTAVIGLEASGLQPGGRIALIFKRLPPGRFDAIEGEMRQILELQQSQESPPVVALRHDDLGYDWLTLESKDFQESLAALYVAATWLLEAGYGDLLLATMFSFAQAGRAVYWLYSFKRGTFYPFVPAGSRQRDTAEELRLATLAASELPVEPDRALWYPLWDSGLL